MIIGIAGGSGSGKSTLCQHLIQALGPQNVAHIMQDNYYRQNDSGTDLATLNYDHPDALEFDLLTQHIQQLMMQEPIQIPLYDFATHNRQLTTLTISPRPCIIVEGILILSQPSLRALFDFSVFVTAHRDLRFARRVVRDQAERSRSYQSIEQQFNATVNPMHELFVEPSKAFADLVVSGEADFDQNLRIILQALDRNVSCE